MTKTNSIFFILGLIFLACSDDPLDSYQNEGTITGADLRLCACCGGFFIDIENSTYRFYTLPEDAGIDLLINQSQYPVGVYLDWEPRDPQCLGDEIDVLRVEEK